jgi:hypothetical protein
MGELLMRRREMVLPSGEEELFVNDILTLDGIKNTRNGHSANVTAWEDLSGNKNDFTKLSTSTPVWNSDNAYFNDASQALGLSKNLFGTDKSVSVELIAQVVGPGSSQDAGAYIGAIFDNRGWGTGNSSYGLCAYSYNTGGISSYWKATSLGWSAASAEKAYICWVFESGNCYRYVNGNLASTTAVSTFFDGHTRQSNFAIGRISGASGKACNARIYRIGMDSSAFTAEEVAARYLFFADRFSI